MPLPFHRRRLDPDAADFCRRSGATDRAAINAFVRGVKDLGLWNNMVCWPLRSSQNAGNGDTVHSLGGLGTFNGTRVNGPAWGADGIDNIDNSISTGHITTPLNLVSAGFSNTDSTFAAVLVTASTSAYGVAIGNETSGSWTESTGLAYTASNSNKYYHAGQTGGSPATTSGVMTGFHAVSAIDATNTLFINGTSIATGNPNRTAFANTGIFMLAGSSLGTPQYYLRARMAFGAALSKGITSAQASALYTLYRNTLGTGLGLP